MNRRRGALLALLTAGLLALTACGPVAVINAPIEKPVELRDLYPAPLELTFDGTTSRLTRDDRDETTDCAEYFEDFEISGCLRALHAWYLKDGLQIALVVFEMEDVPRAREFFQEVYFSDPAVELRNGDWNATDRVGRYILGFWVTDAADDVLDEPDVERAKSLAHAVSAWFAPRVDELRRR